MSPTLFLLVSLVATVIIAFVVYYFNFPISFIQVFLALIVVLGLAIYFLIKISQKKESVVKKIDTNQEKITKIVEDFWRIKRRFQLSSEESRCRVSYDGKCFAYLHTISPRTDPEHSNKQIVTLVKIMDDGNLQIIDWDENPTNEIVENPISLYYQSQNQHFANVRPEYKEREPVVRIEQKFDKKSDIDEFIGGKGENDVKYRIKQ